MVRVVVGVEVEAGNRRHTRPSAEYGKTDFAARVEIRIEADRTATSGHQLDFGRVQRISGRESAKEEAMVKTCASECQRSCDSPEDKVEEAVMIGRLLRAAYERMDCGHVLLVGNDVHRVGTLGVELANVFHEALDVHLTARRAHHRLGRRLRLR